MLGIVSLVTEGVRTYYRAQRRSEISRYHHELADEVPVQLVSATVPVRTRLLESLRADLRAACPTGWEVEDHEGLLLVRQEGVPRLLVELQAPATSSRAGSSATHASAGAPAYWVLDPVWLRVTVLGLLDGRYVESARSDGPVFTAQEPFPVTLRLQAD